MTSMYSTYNRTKGEYNSFCELFKDEKQYYEDRKILQILVNRLDHTMEKLVDKEIAFEIQENEIRQIASKTQKGCVDKETADNFRRKYGNNFQQIINAEFAKEMIDDKLIKIAEAQRSLIAHNNEIEITHASVQGTLEHMTAIAGNIQKCDRITREHILNQLTGIQTGLKETRNRYAEMISTTTNRDHMPTPQWRNRGISSESYETEPGTGKLRTNYVTEHQGWDETSSEDDAVTEPQEPADNVSASANDLEGSEEPEVGDREVDESDVRENNSNNLYNNMCGYMSDLKGSGELQFFEHEDKGRKEDKGNCVNNSCDRDHDDISGLSVKTNDNKITTDLSGSCKVANSVPIFTDGDVEMTDVNGKEGEMLKCGENENPNSTKGSPDSDQSSSSLVAQQGSQHGELIIDREPCRILDNGICSICNIYHNPWSPRDLSPEDVEEEWYNNSISGTWKEYGSTKNWGQNYTGNNWENNKKSDNGRNNNSISGVFSKRNANPLLLSSTNSVRSANSSNVDMGNNSNMNNNIINNSWNSEIPTNEYGEPNRYHNKWDMEPIFTTSPGDNPAPINRIKPGTKGDNYRNPKETVRAGKTQGETVDSNHGDIKLGGQAEKDGINAYDNKALDPDHLITDINETTKKSYDPVVYRSEMEEVKGFSTAKSATNVYDTKDACSFTSFNRPIKITTAANEKERAEKKLKAEKVEEDLVNQKERDELLVKPTDDQIKEMERTTFSPEVYLRISDKDAAFKGGKRGEDLKQFTAKGPAQRKEVLASIAKCKKEYEEKAAVKGKRSSAEFKKGGSQKGKLLKSADDRDKYNQQAAATKTYPGPIFNTKSSNE